MESHATPSQAVDVSLVVPAFDAISFPPLGSAVLAAACRARGLAVAVHYGSLSLAARIGYDAYRAVCNSPLRTLLGERTFLSHAYSAAELATLGPTPATDPSHEKLLRLVAGAIAPHLEELVAEILARRPRIVGIASTFQQNLAAFAVARIIKDRAPETCVVIGGANTASPMGDALADVFPIVDHVFAGEADREFPAFCERFVRDGHRPAQRVIACAPIEDMAGVHAPDFSDYFAALRARQQAEELPPELPLFVSLEGSRGCWWGAKHHCTFCGLNGETMSYRAKAPERVVEEIQQAAMTWDVDRVHMADNIMPARAFDDLLPALADQAQRPHLFYEVKANLRDDQLDTMARAGIDAIQPGIESLSSHVLALMRKGVTGLQNLGLLRGCRSRNISVMWNYLYGFPGEQVEDYASVLALLPQLEHLQPPTGCAQIVIDRFSPYFEDPAAFGIASIAPFAAYAALYPAAAPVADIAYHFTGHYVTPLLAQPELVAELRAGLERWQARWATGGPPPTLRAIDIGPAGIAITDTRSSAVDRMFPISRDLDATLRYCERPRHRAGLPPEVGAHVDELLARRLLLEHDGDLLSLVTRSGGRPAVNPRPQSLRVTP